jgi:hypothetical protein
MSEQQSESAERGQHATQQADADKKAPNQSVIESVLTAVTPKAVQRLVDRIPQGYRRPVLLLVLVVLVVSTSAPIAPPVLHAAAEIYGPDVHIGIADPSALGKFGSKSLLFEFVFGRDKFATSIEANSDIMNLFSRPPIAMLRPECEIAIGDQRMRVYQLVIVIQNSGHRTAKGYEAMITFSSRDLSKPDPGIRILGSSMDSLTVGYRYQQLSDDSISTALKSCTSPAVTSYLKDEAADQATPKQPGAEGAPHIPQLTRDTYQSLGLTRDLIILDGTLEAHLFQAATLLVAAPANLNEFATVFHVECENCSFFYKTISYGEMVALQGGQVAATQ